MASAFCELEKIPAVTSLFFVATSTIFFTPSARSAGVRAALWSNQRFGASAPLPSAAFAIGNRSGSASCALAIDSADCTARFRLSSSKRLVVARAVLPSKAARMDAISFTSETFWWIVLLANRVSEKLVEEKMISSSGLDEYFLTRSKISLALVGSSMNQNLLILYAAPTGLDMFPPLPRNAHIFFDRNCFNN